MMVKICGITNREDALAAVEAGAQAIGFNFYPKSPRYISPEMAAEIGEGVSVLKVGVFVNEPNIAGIARRARIDVVQLHGEETAADAPAHLRTWKAFKIGPEWRPAVMADFNVEAFLLDGLTPGQGRPFDWKQAIGLRNVILAGGLGPENVAEAIRQARPWGVDACSRLERTPGFKDHDKVRRFVLAAMDTL